MSDGPSQEGRKGLDRLAAAPHIPRLAPDLKDFADPARHKRQERETLIQTCRRLLVEVTPTCPTPQFSSQSASASSSSRAPYRWIYSWVAPAFSCPPCLPPRATR